MIDLSTFDFEAFAKKYKFGTDEKSIEKIIKAFIDPEQAYSLVSSIPYHITEETKGIPELEPLLSTNVKYLYYYCHTIFGCRRHDFEPIILTDPYYSFYYARDIIKDKWLEAEPVILKEGSPSFLFEYARFTRKRWKKAEPTISLDYDVWTKYVRFLLNLSLHSIMKLEIIKRSPEIMNSFDDVLIWSGEHQSWLGPDRCGYTKNFEFAGIYNIKDAYNNCCNMNKIEFYPI